MDYQIPVQVAELIGMLVTAIALVLPIIGITDGAKGIRDMLADAVPFVGSLSSQILSWAVALVVLFASVSAGWIDVAGLDAAAIWSIASILANTIHSKLYAS